MASDVYTSASFEINLDITTEEGRKNLLALQKEQDKILKEMAKKKREMVASWNKTMSAMNTGINVMKNVYIAMGGTLNPIQEAMLSVITGTLTTMQSVTTAYATMGPVGWGAAAIVGAASIIFNIQAQFNMLTEMDDARRQMSAATSAMDGLLTLGTQIFS